MNISDLVDALVTPEVKKILLAGNDVYHCVSAAKTPEGLCVRLYLPTDPGNIPNLLTIDGESFPVIVETGYAIPMGYAAVLGRKFNDQFSY